MGARSPAIDGQARLSIAICTGDLLCSPDWTASQIASIPNMLLHCTRTGNLPRTVGLPTASPCSSLAGRASRNGRRTILLGWVLLLVSACTGTGSSTRPGSDHDAGAVGAPPVGSGWNSGVPTDSGASAGAGAAASTNVSFAQGGTTSTGYPGSATGGSDSSLGGAPQGGAGTDCALLEFTTAPQLTQSENDAVPLAALLSVETNLPATGTVRIASADEAWTLSLEPARAKHEKVLLGVKPGTEYQVTLAMTGGCAEPQTTSLTWHTPALPADFPHLNFAGSEPTRMQPGMTIFDVRWAHFIIIVDDRGEVRWFYRAPQTSDRQLLLSNGHLAYLSPDDYVTEIDWFGNVVNLWYAAELGSAPAGSIPVDVGGFHHNLYEMPNGNLLTLCRDHRTIRNFPTSDTAVGRATARVAGDELVEFTRTGDIVKRYSLFDIIDPLRIGHTEDATTDWSHSNAIVYDASSDAYLVSIRHQDAVIKVRRSNGSLVWILGNHANWRNAWQQSLLTPVGDGFQWPYHQHAVQLLAGGVGLYDNGNYRAPAYQEPNPPYFSRAVRFSIDEAAMTISQTWAYEPKLDGSLLYSSAMSDADWQPNGNVLIASGALMSTRESPGWAQIVEVTEAGEPVFELHVMDTAYGTTFDADRIPDIRFLPGIDDRVTSSPIIVP